MQLHHPLRAFALASIAAALSACAGGPSLRPISPPPPSAFERPSVVRGALLAKAGDCMTCHTAEDGDPYAGGRPIHTPFGAVYATNITPDPETGIGRWSQAAFLRAMRQGVRRDGAHLYPAFPYDHFTRASDADVTDLYAFLMTRRPVQARAPPNRLVPPVGFRPLIGFWKLLFFRPGRFGLAM